MWTCPIRKACFCFTLQDVRWPMSSHKKRFMTSSTNILRYSQTNCQMWFLLIEQEFSIIMSFKCIYKAHYTFYWHSLVFIHFWNWPIYTVLVLLISVVLCPIMNTLVTASLHVQLHSPGGEPLVDEGIHSPSDRWDHHQAGQRHGCRTPVGHLVSGDEERHRWDHHRPHQDGGGASLASPLHRHHPGTAVFISHYRRVCAGHGSNTISISFTYILKYLYIYIYIYIYMYVCMYVYVCVYMYTVPCESIRPPWTLRPFATFQASNIKI